LCFEISEGTVSEYVVTKCVDHRDIDAETASHCRLVRTLAAETCDEIITNHSFARPRNFFRISQHIDHGAANYNDVGALKIAHLPIISFWLSFSFFSNWGCKR
jgi:hypothetical protein